MLAAVLVAGCASTRRSAIASPGAVDSTTTPSVATASPGEATTQPAATTTTGRLITPAPASSPAGPTAPSPTAATAGATAAPASTASSATTTARSASPRPTLSADEATSVDLAKQDLAKRLGVPAYRLRVDSVTSVAWPTSALGCPRPGLLYSQLVTPGYRIVLEAGGQTYEYHSDRGRRVVSCP